VTHQLSESRKFNKVAVQGDRSLRCSIKVRTPAFFSEVFRTLSIPEVPKLWGALLVLGGGGGEVVL
jgi:hypothetical protein